MANCQGLSNISKKDFLSLFWPAFQKAFSPSNTHSAFKKTGLYPLDLEPVLSKLSKPTKASITTTNSQEPQADRPSSNHSNNSVISASDWRKIRAIFHEVVGENKAEHTEQVTQLSDIITALTTQCALLKIENKIENKGLKTSFYNVKKQNKRKQGLFQ